MDQEGGAVPGQSWTEVSEIIRDMIRHEDTLVNERMTWFLTIQGLLFAALALSWDKEDSVFVVVMLAVLGMIVCFSCRFALLIGPRAVGELESWWDDHRPPDYDGPDVIGYRIDAKRRRILWPWEALPIAMALAWTAVGSAALARWHL